MNIFGEGFPEEIIKQIKYRQEIYGSGYDKNREPEQISYLNSNTSWCKLVSGVDIDNNDLINNPTIRGLKLATNELARKFVLFNGTADSNGTGQRAGIYPGNNILGGDSAYGIGGTDFGINPMMGIISANIKHENRGSLRRAEIKIKAFNRAQFEIIDALYLRLGFSVLLEWGHAITINNNGVINFNPQYSLSEEFLYGGGSTYDDMLQLIYNQRLKSGGNYDAMLGKVANFNWSFNQDGSYDITVYLSSIGDVIESLKINILTNSLGNNNTTTTDTETSGISEAISGIITDEELRDISGDIIDTFAYSHDIGNFLYICKSLISKENPALNQYSALTSQDIQISYNAGANYGSLGPLSGISRVLTDIGLQSNREDIGVKTLSLFNSNQSLQDDLQNYIKNLNKGLNLDLNIFGESGIDKDDIMVVEFDNLGDLKIGDDVRYYIRLGVFLKFLEKYIVFNVQSKNNNFSTKILKFDTDPLTNIMGVNRLQVSVDPRICYVNTTLGLDSELYTYGAGKNNSNFILYKNKDTYYGNIMNIYLDTTFILNKINELKDDKGNLSAIDFLKGLLNGINEGLGGINDLDVFIDENNNYVRIIDKNPLPYVEDVIDYLNTNIPQFIFDQYNNKRKYNKINLSDVVELYGYNPASVNIPFVPKPAAGFISEFSLTSNLSPQFSTMITVGAAANASVVGEDDTGLSKLNKGYSDRYKHIASSGYVNPSSSINPTKADYDKKVEEFNKMLKDYKTFLKLLSNNPAKNRVEVEATDIDAYKNVLTSLIQKATEIDKLKNQLISTGQLTTTSPSSQPIQYIGNNPENNNNFPQLIPPQSSQTQNGYIKLLNDRKGFLPFNLSLTMNGLSGIKINQQFLLNTRFLPTNYPDVLKFLIKNLSHEISNNKWVTKVETYAIPKEPNYNEDQEPSVLYNILSQVTGSQTNSTNNSTNKSKVEIISFSESSLKPFLYPIDGFITSKIGSRQGKNGNYHYGIDVGAPKNTPVYAAYSGKVTRIGANGYGPNAVYIEIDPSNYNNPNKVSNKFTCIYGHLNSIVDDKGKILVKVGQFVKAGDLIGKSGDLDSPDSFHLHFQIQGGTNPIGANKPNSADIVVDLNSYFPDVGRVIAQKTPSELTKPTRGALGGTGIIGSRPITQ